MGILKKKARKGEEKLKTESAREDNSQNSESEKTYETASLAYFQKIIAEEQKKPLKKRDVALMDECIKATAEIKGAKSAFTEEELDAKVQEATSSKAGASTYGSEKGVRRRRLRKPVLIIAVLVLALLVFSVTTVAGVPSNRKWFFKLIRMPVGSQIYEDGITYIYAGRTQTYRDVEELFEKENLKILYPGKLPEGVHIKDVEKSTTHTGLTDIFFTFDTANVFYSVIIDDTQGFVPDDTFTPYVITEDCTAYYCEDTFRNNVYWAIFLYDGSCYSITAPDCDSLLFILENLKGF